MLEAVAEMDVSSSMEAMYQAAEQHSYKNQMNWFVKVTLFA